MSAARRKRRALTASVRVAAVALASAAAMAGAASPPRTQMEIEADQCLEWYRPKLLDPRGAYWREARRESRVITIRIYHANDRGGYDNKLASCEISGGRLDEDWTRIHARRDGW